MEKVSNGELSAPINLQTLLQPSNGSASEMVIQLKGGHLEPWLPGQSKNWTGIQSQSAAGFQSTQTEHKAWNENAHSLGGSAGIDTGVARLTGAIRPFSQSAHSLQLQLYLVNPTAGTRRLISQLSLFAMKPSIPVLKAMPIPIQVRPLAITSNYVAPNIVNSTPNTIADAGCTIMTPQPATRVQR